MTPGEQQCMWEGGSYGAHGVQVCLCQIANPRPCLTAPLFILMPFVVHVRVQMKYGYIVYRWGC